MSGWWHKPERLPSRLGERRHGLLRGALAWAVAAGSLGACRAPAGPAATLRTERVGVAVAEVGTSRSPAAAVVSPAPLTGEGRALAPAPPPPVRTVDSPPPLARAPLHTGAFLVRLGPGIDAAALVARPPLAGTRLSGVLALGSGTLARVLPPEGVSLPAWRAALTAESGVASITPEGRRYRFQATSADPLVPQQWAHVEGFTDTPGAWALVPKAEQGRVVVAVLDSGLDVGHPEFAGRVVGARNTVQGGDPADVDDGDGHGTHVAGIVAADGANGVGVAGVAWGVKVMPVKVFPDSGAGSDFDILAGFLYALRWRPAPDDGSRVRVINMSLGSATGEVNVLWTEAFALARQAGVLVCVASGNESLPFVASPANCPGAIAIGSTNRYLGWEGLSPFSNGGSRLDLVAPGEAILSTLPRTGARKGQDYGFTSGTSMATPYVAGVAALLCARYDRMNTRLDATFVDAAVARLRAATVDLGQPGRDDQFGDGRVDPRRAVAPASLEAAP